MRASMNSDIRARSRFGLSFSIVAGIAIASLVLSLFASIVVPFTASAASSSFKSPTDADAQNQWNSQNNAYNNDNVYAFADHDDFDQGYDEFGGFSLLGGEVVTGILAEIDAKQEGTACQLQARLSWNNGSNFTSYKTLVPTAGETTLLFGGLSDTWGRSWSVNDFLNANFVLEIRYNDPGSGCDTDGGGRDKVSVDHIRVKVYYNPADVTPPVVTITPASQTVEATGPSGAQATFGASANEPLSGSISCTPVSGSTFALGATTVTCSATDVAGNTGSGSATVTVEDTTGPEITLTGSATLNLNVGDTFTDEGATAEDLVDGDVPVIVDGDTVNTTVPGTYVIYYNASDEEGNDADEVSRTVTVSDVSAPEVTITPASQTVEATGPSGATANYTVSAIDDVDGDISGSATCGPIASGATFPLGVTTITCTATDSSELTGSGAGTVTVVDTTAPVITLTGSATVTFVVGGSYTEEGATATDIVDGSVSVTVGGEVVDLNTVGTYVVTYNVTDAAGNNAVEVTRTVQVTAPVCGENQHLVENSCVDNIPPVPECSGNQHLVENVCVDNAPEAPAPTGNGGNGGGGGGGVVGNGPFSIGFVNTNNGGHERKDVMSGFFFLLTLWSYAGYV